LFNIPAATGAANDHFDRATGYGYLTVEPLDNLRLTAGLTYDTETFPQNFRQPPISSGQDSRSQLGPKAALVWSPFSQVSLRGIYAQSLGGVSLDESIRLEPTQLAGFPQAFRSLISESVVGSLSAPKYDITGLALDFKLEPGIYAGIIAEQLKCNVRQDLGTFLLQNGNTPAITGSTPERLDYTERDLGVNLNKLIGNDVVVGASYQLISADLRETLPGVPLALLPTAAQKLDATLHEATAYLVFNHPSGFFARAETQWYSQANAGYTPAEPGDDFSQHNIYAGWRFDHRHAELMLGLLNLAGRDYRLNPLTVYSELPRGRVFEARLKFEF
jgi:outer membrane receptor protein involved in Fe transport